MKIYELLDSPQKWTQRAFSRNRYDYRVIPSSPTAYSWCLDGAAMKCYKFNDYVNIINKLEAVIKSRFNKELVDFNDSGTYEEVFSLVKELDV